jgi:hypothetical protein
MNPSIGIMVSNEGNRFVNGILESKQWLCNTHGQLIEQKIDRFSKKISKMPNTFISSKKADFIGKALTDFFSDITGI